MITKSAGIILLLTILLSPAMAQVPTVATGTPLQLMTPDAFAKSGLSKLTPDELSYLGSWLNAYEKFAAQRPAGGGAAAVVETRIDGEFNGWEGETVYKMMNGQIWQQSSYHYHYHYAYSPEVLIYPSGGRYKIHVKDDNDQDVSVIRLK